MEAGHIDVTRLHHQGMRRDRQPETVCVPGSALPSPPYLPLRPTCVALYPREPLRPEWILVPVGDGVVLMAAASVSSTSAAARFSIYATIRQGPERVMARAFTVKAREGRRLKACATPGLNPPPACRANRLTVLPLSPTMPNISEYLGAVRRATASCRARAVENQGECDDTRAQWASVCDQSSRNAATCARRGRGCGQRGGARRVRRRDCPHGDDGCRHRREADNRSGCDCCFQPSGIRGIRQ